MIELVIRRLTVGSFAANCYLVMDDASKAGFVIDPGGEGDRIVKELSRMGMKTKAILLTHGHYDHFAGVDPVVEFTGAPVRMNRHDACWYSRIPSFLVLFLHRKLPWELTWSRVTCCGQDPFLCR